MKIEMLNPEELIPFEKNPRINRDAVEEVKKSIREHGFNQPLVANLKKEICVGHTRWVASKELGLKEIPVYMKKMSRKQFLAYNLADNKTSEKSKWDYDLLSEIMMEIKSIDERLLSSTGFSESEIDALTDVAALDDLISDEIEVSGHTRVKGGEKIHVKMVQIFLNDVTFPKFLEMIEVIQTKNNKDNMTDAVYYAVEQTSK